MIYHLWGHWKWFKLVFQKGLWAVNRQVLILSVLFLVALTGFVPWFIDSVNGDHGVRRILIEIHDKLTIVFSIFLILHIIRRFAYKEVAILAPLLAGASAPARGSGRQGRDRGDARCGRRLCYSTLLHSTSEQPFAQDIQCRQHLSGFA